MREIKRAAFSPRLESFQLKSHYKMRTGGAGWSAALPPVADDPALAALPPFPDLTIMDDDESCFALSDDEPIITAINVAPLPDAEAIGAAMSLEPIGGSDPSDGYFAHSEAFMSPVPESLPIGLFPGVPQRGLHKRRAPAGIDALVENLANGPEHVAKGFIQKRAKHLAAMKRPAGALLKRPAAAPPLDAPAPKAAKPAEPALDAASPAAAAPESALPNFEDFAGTLQKCKETCCDPPRVPLGVEGRIVCSLQHNTYLVQVFSGKVQVCMVSEKQFGSRKGANAAGAVLAEMWNAGASKTDLQRCKNAGALFGVKCGKAAH